MKRKEKFKQLDKLKLSPTEVKAYHDYLRKFNRIKFVYGTYHGLEKISAFFDPDCIYPLIGIALNSEKMLYIEAVTKRKMKRFAEQRNLNGKSAGRIEIEIQEMLFDTENLPLHFGSEKEMRLLFKHRAELERAFELLKREGWSVPKLNFDCLMGKKEFCKVVEDKHEFIKEAPQTRSYAEYTEQVGDIPLFTEYLFL